MIKEDKQLLLKDLCARLPYGVYVLVHDTFEYSTVPFENVYLKSSDISSLIDSISLNERYNSKDKKFNRIIKERKDFLEFKPYLRPMSSMTEEEKKEYHKQVDIDLDRTAEGLREQFKAGTFHPENKFTPQYCHIDWLNTNHFDFRGLIPMGLALEAPADMYKTE